MGENNNYPDTVNSRSVEIIETIINQEEYDIPPQSRLEEVLLELKEVIEEGGGGGNVYVTTTPLVDGASTNPIIVNGESVIVGTGDIAVYNHKEFIWNGSAWDELGDLSGLGSLAFKDTASGTVIITDGTLPSLVYDSTNERLIFDAGALPTTGTVTVS